MLLRSSPSIYLPMLIAYWHSIDVIVLIYIHPNSRQLTLTIHVVSIHCLQTIESLDQSTK